METHAMKENALGIDKSLVTINPTTLLNAESKFTAAINVQEQPVTWLADAIGDAVDAASYREYQLPASLKVDGVNDLATLFIAVFKVTLGARIAQCNNRSRFDKKNFEYPSLLGPIIGAYGVYHNAEEAYDIYPVAGDDLTAELKRLGALDKAGFFVVPEWYPEAMRTFRKVHISTNYGLPKDVTVDNPDTFKITVENAAVIGRPGASVDDVFIAALVSSSKLTDLFGSYRTLYCGITALRTAIENVGLKALHDLKQG